MKGKEFDFIGVQHSDLQGSLTALKETIKARFPDGDCNVVSSNVVSGFTVHPLGNQMVPTYISIAHVEYETKLKLVE